MKKTGYVISIDSKDYMLPMAVAELIESLRQDCDSSRKRIATLEKALTDIKHQTDSIVICARRALEWSQTGGSVGASDFLGYATPRHEVVEYDAPIVTRAEHENAMSKAREEVYLLRNKVEQLSSRLVAINSLPPRIFSDELDEEAELT